MTVLITGATGHVGRQVVHQLANRSTGVRVPVRDPSKVDFSAGVNVMQDDTLDIESLRHAFVGVRTSFPLNAVAGSEFTQALLALNVARKSGIEHVVYLSVMYAGRFVNVPHFAVRSGVKHIIEQIGFSATILRPAYFMDNGHMTKDVIVNRGVYPIPIGSEGVVMVGTRGIVEVATIELIHQDAASGKLPAETISLVDPGMLTGPKLTSIQSETLGRPIAYGGDDPDGSETNLTNFLPKWVAYEMRLMAERYVSDDMVPQAGDVECLACILGRSLGTYHDSAATLTQ